MMEQEAVFGEMLSMAQATRRAGGIVVVQVKRLSERRTLPAQHVKIPRILVDLVVLDPTQRQLYLIEYSPALPTPFGGRQYLSAAAVSAPGLRYSAAPAISPTDRRTIQFRLPELLPMTVKRRNP
jgi:acyl CoA:acetate/3-ketoacid CoA transferase